MQESYLLYRKWKGSRNFMADKIRESKVRCSFCHKTEDQVQKLIAGPDGAYICDQCIAICSEIMEEELGGYERERGGYDGEINLLKPEIHDQSLMPALQSIWFIPHVTVYMFSYSVLGCAFIIALCGLVHHKEEYLVTADNLVYSGVAFLSIGMLLGSLWAKEAWGNYWSWDPKETWAVVTWMGYLLYIHLRLRRKFRKRMLYVILIFSFLALQMCWYGVNYLPSAQQSVHLYNRNN